MAIDPKIVKTTTDKLKGNLNLKTLADLFVASQLMKKPGGAIGLERQRKSAEEKAQEAYERAMDYVDSEVAPLLKERKQEIKDEENAIEEFKNNAMTETDGVSPEEATRLAKIVTSRKGGLAEFNETWNAWKLEGIKIGQSLSGKALSNYINDAESYKEDDEDLVDFIKKKRKITSDLIASTNSTDLGLYSGIFIDPNIESRRMLENVDILEDINAYEAQQLGRQGAFEQRDYDPDIYAPEALGDILSGETSEEVMNRGIIRRFTSSLGGSVAPDDWESSPAYFILNSFIDYNEEEKVLVRDGREDDADKLKKERLEKILNGVNNNWSNLSPEDKKNRIEIIFSGIKTEYGSFTEFPTLYEAKLLLNFISGFDKRLFSSFHKFKVKDKIMTYQEIMSS